MKRENNYSKYAFKYVIQGIRKKGFIFLVDVSPKPNYNVKTVVSKCIYFSMKVMTSFLQAYNTRDLSV